MAAAVVGKGNGKDSHEGVSSPPLNLDLNRQSGSWPGRPGAPPDRPADGPADRETGRTARHMARQHRMFHRDARQQGRHAGLGARETSTTPENFDFDKISRMTCTI